MLVTAKEMLQEAKKGKYAIGAFNVENMEMVMAVLAAAEAKNSPVIMQTTPGTIKYAGVDYYYANVAAAAARSKVPVVMHLDHGAYRFKVGNIKIGCFKTLYLIHIGKDVLVC